MMLEKVKDRLERKGREKEKTTWGSGVWVRFGRER